MAWNECHKSIIFKLDLSKQFWTCLNTYKLYHNRHYEGAKRRNNNIRQKEFGILAPWNVSSGTDETRKIGGVCPIVVIPPCRLLIRKKAHNYSVAGQTTEQASANLAKNRRFGVNFSDGLGLQVKWANGGTETIYPIKTPEAELIKHLNETNRRFSCTF